MSKNPASEPSRREFLEGAGAALVIATAVPGTVAGQQQGGRAAADPDPETVPRTAIRLTVNGRVHEVTVEDRWTLAELLRDYIGLTGTKLGCDRGECGACTVLLDDAPVYACSQLAVWADGRTVLTVEGLAEDDRLDPVQEAFIDFNGPQCGFCTSGQLMSAKALLNSNPTPTPDQVRAALVGNLCRCSNYNAIVEAVVAAATRRPGNGGAQ